MSFDTRTLFILAHLLLACCGVMIIGYHVVRHHQLTHAPAKYLPIAQESGKEWMLDSAKRDAEKIIVNGLWVVAFLLAVCWALFSGVALAKYVTMVIAALLSIGLAVMGGYALMSAGGGLALVIWLPLVILIPTIWQLLIR